MQPSPNPDAGTYSACGGVDVDVVLVRAIRLSQMSLAPVAHMYDSPVLRHWAFMKTVGVDTCCIAVLLTYRQQQCCFSCTCHFPCSRRSSDSRNPCSFDFRTWCRCKFAASLPGQRNQKIHMHGIACAEEMWAFFLLTLYLCIR